VATVLLPPRGGLAWTTGGRRRHAAKLGFGAVIVLGTPIELGRESGPTTICVAQNRAVLDLRFATARRLILSLGTWATARRGALIGVAPTLFTDTWIPIGFDLTPESFGEDSPSGPWIVPGSLSDYRDWRTVVSLAKALPDEVFAFVGAGTNSAWFHEELRRAQVKNVRGYGILERSELMDQMRASRGIILASKVEAYPVLSLEAAATGRPTIASDIDGHWLTLGDLPNVAYYRPGSVAALEAAVTSGRPTTFEALAKAWYVSNRGVRIREQTMADAYLDLLAMKEDKLDWPWLR
jgi:glycosyltransferase involved in cell wall biosynthesis